MMKEMSDEEIEEAVKEYYPKLLELLRKKRPELIPEYESAFGKATNLAMPLAIRYYYSAKILETFIRLTRGEGR